MDYFCFVCVDDYWRCYWDIQSTKKKEEEEITKKQQQQQQHWIVHK